MNGHLVAQEPWWLKDKWLAVNLQDGSTDGTLYDTKREAVRHQLDEFMCAYFCFRNCLGGITPKEAMIWLDWVRKAYDAGFRMPDPDAQHGGKDVFMSVDDHDIRTGKNVRLKLN